MNLKELVGNSIKIGMIAGSIFLASNSFGQKPLEKILKKYNTDTMSYNVENVVLLEQEYGIKKPKGFDELYQQFMNAIPTKEKIDSLTKNMGEEEKTEFIFKNIGDALSTITSRHIRTNKFILSTIYENKLFNDCDAFSTFYASAIEKIYQKPLDSTKFVFKRIQNHVYVGYEGETKTYTWETTRNKKISKNNYEKLFDNFDEFNEKGIKSDEMWSTLFYSFAINEYEKNEKQSREYFDKAKEMLKEKDNFFEETYNKLYVDSKNKNK